ncbi:hypothetical protein HBI56_208920 [Parastagonospora nodorum]|uniref:Uncharacterized protein n=1 Tax=Phaeosphaeria nodorum (strain SN15 / ATCC MYA-4574 / FGSC 10173) TaxID=321614 RepID=A0A7U2F9J0_PHANO|nr:hypothetical protein HBH56_219880 [Parastagonospora nodorum]QRD01223.1 hypothetical protein JI435_438970 [Parastagonospora nodorum SN15]KAH3921991.1 hypothetical protein HBH54_230010 [Parastagonospora nodorum]KAH3941276.1 hypothetical protein HBH53_203880 [Parastagonospora nodorum]KAH3958684.1 hypothetical protein HBH51_207150 [Parastagonospora nodorum]
MSQLGSSTAASSVKRTSTASHGRTEARPEERISIRKSKAVKYGRRIARLRIGRTRETFAIHEELICSQSTYFREKL